MKGWAQCQNCRRKNHLTADPKRCQHCGQLVFGEHSASIVIVSWMAIQLVLLVLVVSGQH